MVGFVGTPPFLIIALRVAMVTMHFHTAQTGLFLGPFLSHSGYPREQFGTNEKLSFGGCKVGKNRSRVILISFKRLFLTGTIAT